MGVKSEVHLTPEQLLAAIEKAQAAIIEHAHSLRNEKKFFVDPHNDEMKSVEAVRQTVENSIHLDNCSPARIINQARYLENKQNLRVFEQLKCYGFMAVLDCLNIKISKTPPASPFER